MLWHYRRQCGTHPTASGARTRVGGGRSIYFLLIGAGDIRRDSTPGLPDRDRAGVLWRYEGNGKAGNPCNSLIRVGGGWGSATGSSAPPM